MRWMVFALLGVLVLGVTGSLGQNGFQGEHEYQGTQEDTLTGAIVGTITPDAPPEPETETLVREYTVQRSSRTTPGTSTVDLTPSPLTGDVDIEASTTYFRWHVSVGFTGIGESEFAGTVRINGAACSGTSWWILSSGSATNPSRGHGHESGIARCDYSPGNAESLIYSHGITNGLIASSIRVHLEIIHQEVYSRTIPQPSHPSSSFSGTFTGTSTGTHTGEIEDLNLTTQNESADESGFDLFTAAFTDAAGLSALEFMVAPLMGFLGVFLWSRANDGVVRVLGGLLVVFAGLLLLSVGIEQGFGDVWIGLSSFAVILMVVGGYLVVRVFIDHFGGDPQSD